MFTFIKNPPLASLFLSRIKALFYPEQPTALTSAPAPVQPIQTEDNSQKDLPLPTTHKRPRNASLNHAYKVPRRAYLQNPAQEIPQASPFQGILYLSEAEENNVTYRKIPIGITTDSDGTESERDQPQTARSLTNSDEFFTDETAVYMLINEIANDSSVDIESDTSISLSDHIPPAVIEENLSSNATLPTDRTAFINALLDNYTWNKCTPLGRYKPFRYFIVLEDANAAHKVRKKASHILGKANPFKCSGSTLYVNQFRKEKNFLEKLCQEAQHAPISTATIPLVDKAIYDQACQQKKQTNYPLTALKRLFTENVAWCSYQGQYFCEAQASITNNCYSLEQLYPHHRFHSYPVPGNLKHRLLTFVEVSLENTSIETPMTQSSLKKLMELSFKGQKDDAFIQEFVDSIQETNIDPIKHGITAHNAVSTSDNNSNNQKLSHTKNTSHTPRQQEPKKRASDASLRGRRNVEKSSSHSEQQVRRKEQGKTIEL